MMIAAPASERAAPDEVPAVGPRTPRPAAARRATPRCRCRHRPRRRGRRRARRRGSGARRRRARRAKPGSSHQPGAPSRSTAQTAKQPAISAQRRGREDERASCGSRSQRAGAAPPRTRGAEAPAPAPPSRPSEWIGRNSST